MAFDSYSKLVVLCNDCIFKFDLNSDLEDKVKFINLTLKKNRLFNGAYDRFFHIKK